MLWLKISRTNNDPVVVLGFYLETAENEGGCPVSLRTANGTCEQRTHQFKVTSVVMAKMNTLVLEPMFMDTLTLTNELSVCGLPSESHVQIGGLISLKISLIGEN